MIVLQQTLRFIMISVFLGVLLLTFACNRNAKDRQPEKKLNDLIEVSRIVNATVEFDLSDLAGGVISRQLNGDETKSIVKLLDDVSIPETDQLKWETVGVMVIDLVGDKKVRIGFFNDGEKPIPIRVDLSNGQHYYFRANININEFFLRFAK